MPEYLYQNPKTKKIISIIQSIHAVHEYIDEEGLKWNRIFTSPQINTEQKLNSNSTSKDFIQYTKNKKGSLGDLWDASKELSEKRKKLYGKDPIKQDYFNKWSKKRKGKKHPSDRS